jgi:DNA modification methylase
VTEDILTPFLDSAGITLYQGDCIETMRRMPEASIDAIVTDPPYGLGFMGKDWDTSGRMIGQLATGDEKRGAFAYGGSHDRGYADNDPRAFQAFSEAWAREAFRILKPGGHLLAFAGTRTYHRMASGVEDAGFEIRDCIAWMYGSGFPKSLDVSKAIDKKRDDLADVYEVTAWIKESRDKAGIKNRDIDDAFGFAGMAGHWTSSKSQPAVPTLEQVPPLLNVLGVNDDDVPERIRRLLLDLNGRKGQPGDAWFQREVTGERTHVNGGGTSYELRQGPRVEIVSPVTSSATDAARKWEGWGTALKPAFEPIVVARKPLVGTVAQNVLEHGTGALNIDGCRIGATVETWPSSRAQPINSRDLHHNYTNSGGQTVETGQAPPGRWPANVALDDEAASVLDQQSGDRPGMASQRHLSPAKPGIFGVGHGSDTKPFHESYNDSGGASRFFYTAKASRKDRNTNGANNTHPTVKPTKLMQWLITLVLPPGGILLDPFAGSGSTGVAARNLDARCVLIEREDEYVDIIRQRLDDQNLFVQD